MPTPRNVLPWPSTNSIPVVSFRSPVNVTNSSGPLCNRISTRAEYRGRKNVFMAHPLNREVGAVLSRTVDLPSGEKTTLRTVVANDDRGDWVLIVKADGQLLLEKPINQQTSGGGWATVEVDLSGLAGKQVELELVNQPDGWSWEAGYWAEITIRLIASTENRKPKPTPRSFRLECTEADPLSRLARLPHAHTLPSNSCNSFKPIGVLK